MHAISQTIASRYCVPSTSPFSLISEVSLAYVNVWFSFSATFHVFVGTLMVALGGAAHQFAYITA